MALEIERKYLIKIPDLEKIERSFEVKKYTIIQTYLESSGREERRVRKRSCDDVTEYFYTEKVFLTSVSRIENEKIITKSEYESFLLDKKKDTPPVEKIRYVIPWEDHFVEIDIYSFSDDYCTAEIELKDENDSVQLPPFLEVIKEVTGIKEYSNSHIAKNRKIGI